MSRTRLEAFSDAVIAIAMTIMVLELKAPHGTDWAALRPLIRSSLTYVLSFTFLAIYWNNHHHMLHTTDRIDGRILWANMHLLFWLSLIPFVTGWMGENRLAPAPTALYGVVMLMSALAYVILQTAIIAYQGRDSRLRQAVGRDLKGKISVTLYIASIPLAFVNSWISILIYIFVAFLWFIPDRRIETTLGR